jgi:hypothetical protein
VGAALKEALLNAVYRGNLEISFQEMQAARVSLMEGRGEDLFLKRRSQKPYSDRKVYVDVSLDTQQARFVIRDQGLGFDPASLPPPGQPGSLDPEVGRGLVLMRAFMDEVVYNSSGTEVSLVKRRESPP